MKVKIMRLDSAYLETPDIIDFYHKIVLCNIVTKDWVHD